MAVAFHKGLSHELILRLQQAGMRLEEREAQQALAGLLTREVDTRGNPVKSNDNQHAIRSGAAKWILDEVDKVLANRFELMKRWEEDHPGSNPFPDLFPQVVLNKLKYVNDDEAVQNIPDVIQLAEEELLFG